MSNQDNELRNLFREKIDGMEVAPPPKVWKGVEKTMFSGSNWGAIALWLGTAAIVCYVVYLFIPLKWDEYNGDRQTVGQKQAPIQQQFNKAEESSTKDGQTAKSIDTNKQDTEQSELAQQAKDREEGVNVDESEKGSSGSIAPAHKRNGQSEIQTADLKKAGANNTMPTAEKSKSHSPSGPVNKAQKEKENQKTDSKSEEQLVDVEAIERSKVMNPDLSPLHSTTSLQTNPVSVQQSQTKTEEKIEKANDNSEFSAATENLKTERVTEQNIDFMQTLLPVPLAVSFQEASQLSSIPEILPFALPFQRHYYQFHASVGREIRTFNVSNPNNQSLLDKSVALKHHGIGFNYQYQFHPNWAVHTGVYAYRTGFITRQFPISIANQNLDGELVFDTPEGEFKSEPLELSSYANVQQDTTVFLGRIIHRSSFVSLPLAIRYNTNRSSGLNFYTQAGVQFNLRASERNTLVIKKSAFERNFASGRSGRQRKIAPSAMLAVGLQTQSIGRVQYFTELSYARVLGEYYKGPRVSIQSQFVTVGAGLRVAF